MTHKLFITENDGIWLATKDMEELAPPNHGFFPVGYGDTAGEAVDELLGILEETEKKNEAVRVAVPPLTDG